MRNSVRSILDQVYRIHDALTLARIAILKSNEVATPEALDEDNRNDYETLTSQITQIREHIKTIESAIETAYIYITDNVC